MLTGKPCKKCKNCQVSDLDNDLGASSLDDLDCFPRRISESYVIDCETERSKNIILDFFSFIRLYRKRCGEEARNFSLKDQAINQRGYHAS